MNSLEPVELNKYILYSIENYKDNITNTPQEIVTKFIDVVSHFINMMSEKLLSKKQSHYKFILERGIDTVTNVFQMTYCITKNLEVSHHCGQKAFCFYTEFIEQMSDENVSFLKLTSKDATLFVYKRTIYEINNECRKNQKAFSAQEQKIIEDANNLIHLNKMICLFVINNSNMSTIQERESCVKQCIQMIRSIDNLMTSKKEYCKSKNIENACLFISLLSHKNISLESYFNAIKTFIQQTLNLSSRMQLIEFIEEFAN